MKGIMEIILMILVPLCCATQPWQFLRAASGRGNFGKRPVFLEKQVPGWGPEQRESGRTVLYLLIIIILISYIIIKLLIKRRTIPTKTKNGTTFCFFGQSVEQKLNLSSSFRRDQIY